MSRVTTVSASWGTNSVLGRIVPKKGITASFFKKVVRSIITTSPSIAYRVSNPAQQQQEPGPQERGCSQRSLLSQNLGSYRLLPDSLKKQITQSLQNYLQEGDRGGYPKTSG